MGFSAQPLQWVGEKCGGPAPLAYTPMYLVVFLCMFTREFLIIDNLGKGNLD